jgi:DNA-binding GntR family transcriptional regulator
MVEVLDARIWLEPIGTRMAAAHITKAEIARLEEINTEMRAAIGSTEESIMDANERFHRVIAGAIGNLVVQVFTETMLTVADSGVQELHHSKRFKQIAVKGHEEIIAAFKAKDPIAAEEAMRKHVSEGKRRRVGENRDMMTRPLRWVQ